MMATLLRHALDDVAELRSRGDALWPAAFDRNIAENLARAARLLEPRRAS